VSAEIQARRLTRVCRWTAAAVLVVFGVIALLLPAGSAGGNRFGPVDQLLFMALGLLIALGVLALTRPRVRADHTGIWVRNVLAERFYPWSVVVAVHLPSGAPWAQLELQDDQTVGLLAVQANDGALARRSVDRLQARLAASRGK
jgi:hypothetical protein